MKKIETLGVFDSGLGGYSVYQDLKTHFPNLSMVLFADQKYAPYGNYDEKTIIQLAARAMRWFESEGIDDVLLACNTVTSVALETLRVLFPKMRIWGIIDLTLSQLDQNENNVAVFATQATVHSHAYADEFKKKYHGSIQEVALKDLAIAIENLEDEQKIDAMIEEGLKNLDSVTHIILGCTHYPLVKSQFEKASSAIFLDSIAPVRDFIKHHYEKTDGTQRVVTTGSKEHLKKQIEILYQEEEKVETVCVNL